MVVKKKNGKDRVCIDFTNLNKACLKDNFPLPKIHQMVNATTKYPRISFLDAYYGYNQISMKKEDRIHTAYTTKRGLFYYSHVVWMKECWSNVSKVDEQDVCCIPR